MAQINPVDANQPPCPMEVTVELQEDGSSEPLSSLGSDNYVLMENTHPNKVLEGLNRLRLNNAFCDVILCCGGQEFPCHRNVLASFSSYFEAMFTTDLMESKQERVIIKLVEPQMIGMLVNYAYTSKVVISTANVQALLAASHLLNVTAVQDACCCYMERHMDMKNCVAIHILADTYSCKMLAKSSMDYIVQNFNVIYQQEEFLSLCVDKLTEILASDDLNVLNEEMVFEAAMLWLNMCSTLIDVEFEQKGTVLEQIRLPFVGPSYLGSLDVVKECQGCQRLICEAKNQHLLPDSHRAQPRWHTVIIVIMGADADDSDLPLGVACFDPLTKQCRTLGLLPSLPVSLPGVAVSEMVALDGYVFAVGGWTNHGVHTIDRYDPTTNMWQLMRSVTMPEFDIGRPALVALDGLIYVVGTTSHMRSLACVPLRLRRDTR